MSQQDEVEKLIHIHQRRLQKLKEQQAMFGASVDPKIPLEIEDIEAKLDELNSKFSQSDIAEQSSTIDEDRKMSKGLGHRLVNKFLTSSLGKKLVVISELTVAILACVAAWLVVPPFSNVFISPTPTPTVISFDYQVRVQALSTGDPIPNAKVIIDVGNEIAPKDDITDSNGLARVVIDVALVGKHGRLMVQATGYKSYNQNIDLTKGVLPDIIPLEKEAVQLPEPDGPEVSHTPAAPALQCNRSISDDQAGVLKVVIADFNENVTGDNLNIEDRLFDGLNESTSDTVIVCRISQVIGTSVEARKMGQELGAALVLWGRRDSAAFEIGLEVADWELDRMVQSPPQQAESFLFQTKFLPALITLLDNLTLSEIYYLDGDVKPARKILSSALSDDAVKDITDDNAAELASAYWFLGFLFDYPQPEPDLNRALDAYDQALALDKSLQAALLNKGKVLEGLEKPNLAIAAYTQLIEAHSSLAALALVNRANLFHFQDNDEAAMADIKAVIELDPVIGYRQRAEAYLTWWGDADSALKDFQAVIKYEPDNPENYHFLGMTQLKIGQEDEAKQTYQACLPYLDQEMQAFMVAELKALAQAKPQLANAIDPITVMLETASLP